MADIVLGEITRPPTKEEEKDFINIGKGRKKTFQQIIRKKLEEYENKYNKLHKPFCSRCVKIDLEDEREKIAKELSRSVGGDVNPDWAKLITERIDLENLDEYASPSRFIKLKDQEATQKTVIGNQSVMSLIGYHVDYQCKFRGCGHAVFVPIDEWNKENKEKK